MVILGKAIGKKKLRVTDKKSEFFEIMIQ